MKDKEIKLEEIESSGRSVVGRTCVGEREVERV